MTVTINGTTGITNDSGYTGDGISFADSTPANTLVTTTGGNVGIGTSSPAAPLDVARGSSVAAYTSYRGNANASAAEFFVGQGGNNYGYIYNRANGPIEFATNNTTRALIDSSGNLLVGTTSTGYSNSDSFTLEKANGYEIINHTSSRANGAGYILFGYNGGSIGGIVQNGTTAVSYNTTSDYRLKENVQPMLGALAKVTALKPVTYTWKADGSAGQGFIAHELQEVVPDCVTGEKDAVETYTDEEGNEQTRPVYQGIDTSFLVATLTAAIQEQQALITTLTARIETLEAKNA